MKMIWAARIPTNFGLATSVISKISKKLICKTITANELNIFCKSVRDKVSAVCVYIRD